MSNVIFSFLLFSSISFAHNAGINGVNSSQTVLTNLDQALAVGGMILSQDKANNLAVTFLDSAKLDQLSRLNHMQGRCAGFEVLDAAESKAPALILKSLVTMQNQVQSKSPLAWTQIAWNENYQKLADLADPTGLKDTVTWISSYASRNEKLSEPNQHVVELKSRLESWLTNAKWPFQIELISHNSTKQNSLRLTIPGKLRPTEVVVLGAHFDSVNHSIFGSNSAPGADDNASGSGNLIEALKILKNAEQPERTLEFYWYAGEESGLLGSAEIAKAARAQTKNVVAVLQLDMTLFPGSGDQVIGLINDYTSPWLRGVFTSINDNYVKAQLIDDQCGYGCSDHASWHRQNYHAVIPFEATLQTMNHNLHTDQDLIDSKSSFKHSNSFTKYAVLFALILGNSDLHAPLN